MSPTRLLAIMFIFGCTLIGWVLLGTSVFHRSGESNMQLRAEVMQLWGGEHEQHAPTFAFERPRLVESEVEEKDAAGRTVKRKTSSTVIDTLPLATQSSEIATAFTLDHRKKGLLWFATYSVEFRAEYKVVNPDPEPRVVLADFNFPSREAIYDNFHFTLNGAEVAADPQGAHNREPGAPQSRQGDLSGRLDVPGGGAVTVVVSYKTRGIDSWYYHPTSNGVARVNNLHLAMRTDFTGYDFPAGSMSPSSRKDAAGGAQLDWQFESLVTGQKIGIELPRRQNPGPLAARISFFAPVSLLFFFTVMVILGAVRGQNLHPMNYFFLAAAFFSFHLLLAYLVDHLNIHASFVIAAIVSIFLVISYLRLVGGMRFAVRDAGLAQFIFLVLFSYAFFFEGYTGLAVTIGSIVTLFVLMQLTGRVDWNQAFGKKAGTEPPSL